jgi:hypothetical protein
MDSETSRSDSIIRITRTDPALRSWLDGPRAESLPNLALEGSSTERLVLRAVLGSADRTSPAWLARFGRAPALNGRRRSRTAPPTGVRSAECRTRHGAVAAGRTGARQRGARRRTPSAARGLTHRRHHGHCRSGRAPCRRPPRLLTTVVPPTVPAIRAHIVSLRTFHLARRLSRPIVPPSVSATSRTLAEVFASGHAVHRAQRRQRLGRHAVWLRCGGRRLLLPLRSAARRHFADLRSNDIEATTCRSAPPSDSGPRWVSASETPSTRPTTCQLHRPRFHEDGRRDEAGVVQHQHGEAGAA